MSTNSLAGINNVSVVGLGYVGLPTAAIIADCGLNVHGVDTNQQIVETINKGNTHIVEPDLQQLSKIIKEGYRFIAYSVDIRMLDEACRVALNSITNFK